MSFDTTGFRLFARCGWGGKAASHFRGALTMERNNLGMQDEDPQVLGQSYRGQIGTVILRSMGVSVNRTITGVTRDSSGVAVGNCLLDLYITGVDTLSQNGVSDASGNFTFFNPGSGPFYIVAYKVGAPDIAGTTVNTLVGV